VTTVATRPKARGLVRFITVADRDRVQHADAAGETAIVDLRRQLARADRVVGYEARATLCALALAKHLTVLEARIRADAELSGGREGRQLRALADRIAAGRLAVYEHVGVA
jgi:hypothetical protein